jgi:hypothetical protein
MLGGIGIAKFATRKCAYGDRRLPGVAIGSRIAAFTLTLL